MSKKIAYITESPVIFRQLDRIRNITINFIDSGQTVKQLEEYIQALGKERICLLCQKVVQVEMLKSLGYQIIVIERSWKHNYRRAYTSDNNVQLFNYLRKDESIKFILQRDLIDEFEGLLKNVDKSVSVSVSEAGDLTRKIPLLEQITLLIPKALNLVFKIFRH